MAQSSDMIAAVNGVQEIEELEGQKNDSRVYKVVLTGGSFDFYVKNNCYTWSHIAKLSHSPLHSYVCYSIYAIPSIQVRCLFRDRRIMLI